jgi:hypothetical protein
MAEEPCDSEVSETIAESGTGMTLRRETSSA